MNSHTNQPSREEIARCAYELWQESGGVHGHDREHWLRAEALLRGGEVVRFDVVLLPAGDPVTAARAVRDATGLDLATVKALVDAAPGPIVRGVDGDEAERLSTRLNAAGVAIEVVETAG